MCNISKGDLIERCPILLLSETETPIIQTTGLMNYYFQWSEDKKVHPTAICLGFGSLYNHSFEPNATYKKLYAENLIDFVAIKDINKGEEITVNYNYGNPDDKTRLWIKEVPPADASIH